MGKLKSFIAGSVLGAAGMYVGLQYHLLQADEGFLIVPRSPQGRIQDAYADIRTWDASTWTARPRLALAVTEHGRGDLISDGVASGVIDQLRDHLSPLHESLSETSSGWEPATTTNTPVGTKAPTPEAVMPPTQETPAERPPVRRGFMPLADLFGLGRGDASGSAETPAAEEADITPVMPAGVSNRKPVEILPSPREFEMLEGPPEVQLGPTAPLPGTLRHSDRRRTDASGGWEPLSVKSF